MSFFLLLTPRRRLCSLLFFFNDTATTEIYTLSLHDALPISRRWCSRPVDSRPIRRGAGFTSATRGITPKDRKSTRLNSSHQIISYAVFCLKKKKKKRNRPTRHHDSDTQLRSRRHSARATATQ